MLLLQIKHLLDFFLFYTRGSLASFHFSLLKTTHEHTILPAETHRTSIEKNEKLLAYNMVARGYIYYILKEMTTQCAAKRL